MDSRQSDAQEDARDRLFVAMSDSVGLARVEGRGSYKISRTLKQFATRMLEEGRNQLVMDLQGCEGMDSTFMGTLAGISQRYQHAGGEPVMMTGTSPKLYQLMKTLGLDRVVRIQSASWKPRESVSPLSDTPSDEVSDLESAEHILEAHETLCEISPDNLSKFEDCLHFLRQDVENRK
jgi:anti-anti-sigma factor